jgi:hypothetical protein
MRKRVVSSSEENKREGCPNSDVSAVRDEEEHDSLRKASPSKIRLSLLKQEIS